MLHTLIGEAAFQRGMRIYFERHDGQAVLRGLRRRHGGGLRPDLTQFRRWYSQAGTPRLMVRGEHDPRTRTFTLVVAQTTPPTPGQGDKQPLHMPLALGLLDRAGQPLPLQLEGEAAPAGTARVLELSEAEHRFTFTGVGERPPFLLRGFSAPVILESDADDADRRLLMAHDPDPFVRWRRARAMR